MSLTHGIRKRLLIKLMQILGFGGMAAYCIVGCSNQSSKPTSSTPNSETQVADGENILDDSNAPEADSAVLPDSNPGSTESPIAEETNIQVDSNDSDSAIVADNQPNDQTAPKKLSDDELDQLLK